MATALSRLKTVVDRDDVLKATAEYDRLGPEAFFAAHGYGASHSYELVHDGGRYPHKAILGAAYEFATGERLDPADFEGGKAGAVAVLQKLGFTVEAKD
jgi:5-methylcytosine-specific restriction protein A